jgi:hypothetical protein
MYSRLCFLGLLLALQINECAATSRMGEVIVQQSGDMPCFALEDTKSTGRGEPKLGSITIYAGTGENGSSPRRVWSFMVEPSSPGLLLPVGQCVPYGQTPAGARTRTLVKAEPLVPGVLYTVSMGADRSDPHDPTQAYSAEFCIIKQPGASVRVQQIKQDVSLRTQQRGLCERNSGLGHE